MQKITDELIEKFLKGLCTKEESAAVMAYLDQNPDELGLSDEFSLADGEAPLPPGYKDEMLGFILAETGIGVGTGEGMGSRAEEPKKQEEVEAPVVAYDDYPFPDRS